MRHLPGKTSRVLKCLVLSLVATGSAPPGALAKTVIGPQTCRATLEAALNNDAEGAFAALDPDPAEAEEIRELATRMTDSLQGIFRGKAPKLERTLPDIEVANYPAALQIWSFGDREVYFVGCLMRVEAGRPFLHMQAFPRVDEVIKRLETNVMTK